MGVDEREKGNGSSGSGHVEPNGVEASPEVTSQAVTVVVRGQGVKGYEHVEGFTADGDFVTITWRAGGKIKSQAFSSRLVEEYTVEMDEAEMDIRMAEMRAAKESAIRRQRLELVK